MIEDQDTNRKAYAALLSTGLSDVVDDLLTIEPVDLVSYIHYGRFSALEDLIQSSTELFFREGTLRFGWTARVDLTWDNLPALTLGMEFQHKAVVVFFNLKLATCPGIVDVTGAHFDEDIIDPARRLKLLVDAVEDARLPRRAAPHANREPLMIRRGRNA